jgi:FtsP/CotA-like multicopper oxidase with cupredoxin domain
MRLSRRAAILGGAAAGGVALAAPRARAAATLDLVAAERPFPLLGPGRPPVPLGTYAGGAAPLPVFRVRRGEPLRATVENRLPEHTTVHWHGLRIANAMDGVPWLTQRPVYPGERFVYEFAPPDAGTFFFHPHCNTAEQLGRGLAGVLLVEGDAEEGAYDADLVLALKDWRLGEDGRFLPFTTDAGAARAGTFGDVRTVNGAVRPTLDLPAGGDVRLRLVNLDPTRVAEVGIEGAEAALVAVDGHEVGPLPFRSWRLGPAMRIDLVARAPGTGAVVRLVDYFAPQPVELASLRGAGPDRPPRPFEPRGLIPNPLPEPDLRGAERRRVLFSAAPDGAPADLALPDGTTLSYADGLCLADRTFWAIDRASWPRDGHQRLPPPLATLERGRTYLLELVNGTPHQHPIHLHGMSFKVVGPPRRGQPVHWADTVLLGPKDRAEVALVADNPGDWMLHCHVIEHQETGMMGYVRVA